MRLHKTLRCCTIEPVKGEEKNMPICLKEGRGALSGANVAVMLRKLGVKNPMLVAGTRTKDVFFTRTGMHLPVFSAFHANPDLEDCLAGAAQYRAKGCDGLISIGGGSAMDTAKGVKALLLADLPDVLRSHLPADSHLPHLAIPATAGTGAETTAVAVLYENNQKVSVDHPSLLPEGVLLDGSLLDTLPEYHRKSCAMDALAQGIESWWARKATADSRVHAENAIRGVLDHLTNYLSGDADAQDAMLRAAYESGLAILATRTTAAHAMSYQITKKLGAAHGHACMLTLPHLWLHLAQNPQHQPMLEALSALCGGKTAQDGALLLKGLLASLALDNLPMPDDAMLDYLAASVNPERLGNHPELLNRQQLREIYQQAFTPMTADEREQALKQWRQHG